MINHKQKNLNIDIGTRCTLQCSECERTKRLFQGLKIPGQDMTLAQFDKVSNFFIGRQIAFCGTWSDPVFNPNFIDMLKICKSKGVKTEVSTAASHKSIEWYETAFNANLDTRWIFGIDGLPEQSHLYRKNQDGKKLFDVMCFAKKLGINAVWQYIVFPYNLENLEKAKIIAKENKLKMDIVYTTRNQNVKIKS